MSSWMQVHLELLGRYYNRVHGVDFRSLRYPGVISARTKPGGTTDYAVEIYHEALRRQAYDCFLVTLLTKQLPGSCASVPAGITQLTLMTSLVVGGQEKHQILPMMYMPDCLKARTSGDSLSLNVECLPRGLLGLCVCVQATLDLIHAPRLNLTEVRWGKRGSGAEPLVSLPFSAQCVYNVTAMSFTPSQLAASIAAHIPDFQMHYHPDFRQVRDANWQLMAVWQSLTLPGGNPPVAVRTLRRRGRAPLTTPLPGGTGAGSRIMTSRCEF